MALVQAEGYYTKLVQFWNVVFDRPSIIVAIVLYALVWVQDIPSFFVRNQISIFLIVPLLPVIFVDHDWLRNEHIPQELKKKFRSLRMDFMLAGMIFSAFLFIGSIIVLGATVFNPLNSFDNAEYFFQQSALSAMSGRVFNMLFFILFLITLFLTIYFFKIRSINNGNSGYYFNSIYLIRSLISHFFSYTMLIPMLLVIASLKYLDDIYTGFVNVGFQSYFMNTFYSMLLFVFITQSLIQIHLFIAPSFIDKQKLVLKNSQKHLLWAGLLFIVYIIGRSFYLESLTLFNIASTGLEYRFIRKVFIITYIFSGILLFLSRREYRCQTCGLYSQSKHCPVSHENRVLFKFSRKSDVKRALCPNCSTSWQSTDRKCHNCGFTILLACDTCSQTINPLWTRCAYCGDERTPTTEIALNRKTNTDYTWQRATLVLRTLIFFPLLIIQWQIILGFEAKNVNRIFIDHHRFRLQVLAFFFIAVTLLVFRSNQMEKQPIFQILLKLMSMIFDFVYPMFLITGIVTGYYFMRYADIGAIIIFIFVIYLFYRWGKKQIKAIEEFSVSIIEGDRRFMK